MGMVVKVLKWIASSKRDLMAMAEAKGIRK